MSLLELHNIKLTPSDQTSLKLQFEKKGGFVSYKEVLHYIQVNRDGLAYGFENSWVFVNPVSHNKKQQVSRVDVRSGLSSRSSNYSSVSSMDPVVREQAKRILNNSFQPLQNMGKMNVVQEVDGNQEIDYDGLQAEEIRLGDDFQTFNQRNNTITTVKTEDNLILKNIKKKKQAITAKPDQKIIDFQNHVGQIENGIISPLQPPVPQKKDGKKILDSPQKTSNNLITHNHEVNLERRHAQEFPNPQHNSSAVSGLLSNNDGKIDQIQPHKSKISVDYLKKVLNQSEMSDTKLNIIKSLYNENIDFRSLNNLKKNLFESDKLAGNFIPMEEFIIQKDKILKDKMQKTEELLLKEIRVGDDRIDLIKFGELVDLFNYFPVHIKKDKNKSDQLYYVMSSNQRGNPDGKEVNPALPETSLQQILEIVWTKIVERFHTVGQGFRFFDINSNLKISFHEFYNGLDRLRVKLSDSDALRIFEYLDKNGDGEIGYNEFCELCEEKRRKIDPFDNVSTRNTLGSQPRTEQHYYSPTEPKAIYLSNVGIDHLDQLSKFKPLSKTKRNKSLNRSELPSSRSAMFNPVSYGKDSGMLKSESINDVIGQQYLKDFLKDKINRNAVESLHVKSQVPKSIHNKTSQLRNMTVDKYLLKSNFEREIEDLKMAKAEKNELRFVDIEKKHHKIKKDLSLPPIKVASDIPQSSFEDPVLSRNRNPLRLNSVSKLSEDAHSHTLSYTPLKSLQGHKKTGSRNQQEILDEIHQMRLDLLDNMDKKNTGSKPTMTKREKEDILSTYFEAKKKLNTAAAPVITQGKQQ